MVKKKDRNKGGPIDFFADAPLVCITQAIPGAWGGLSALGALMA